MQKCGPVEDARVPQSPFRVGTDSVQEDEGRCEHHEAGL